MNVPIPPPLINSKEIYQRRLIARHKFPTYLIQLMEIPNPTKSKEINPTLNKFLLNSVILWEIILICVCPKRILILVDKIPSRIILIFVFNIGRMLFIPLLISNESGIFGINRYHYFGYFEIKDLNDIDFYNDNNREIEVKNFEEFSFFILLILLSDIGNINIKGIIDNTDNDIYFAGKDNLDNSLLFAFIFSLLLLLFKFEINYEFKMRLLRIRTKFEIKIKLDKDLNLLIFISILLLLFKFLFD